MWFFQHQCIPSYVEIFYVQRFHHLFVAIFHKSFKNEHQQKPFCSSHNSYLCLDPTKLYLVYNICLMSWLFWSYIQISNIRFNVPSKKWRIQAPLHMKNLGDFDLTSNSPHHLITSVFLLAAPECISSSQNKKLTSSGKKKKKRFVSFILNGKLKNYSTGNYLVRIIKLIKFIFGNTSSFFLHHFLLAAFLLTSPSIPRTFIWSNNLGLIWNYYLDLLFLSDRGFWFCFVCSCNSSWLDVG